MRVVVLGGAGIQGRAAVFDLARSPGVDEVISADGRVGDFAALEGLADFAKVRSVPLDATDRVDLARTMGQGDVVIDLLPVSFVPAVCESAIECGSSVVNTNYAAAIASYREEAQAAGVAILPECGLDPGIDLVLYGEAARRFDRLVVIRSYCGGFPDAAAADNVLKYKISWSWEGVLASTMRDSRIVRDGEPIDIPAARQHDAEFVESIEFPGLGTLEAIPNGMADEFTGQLGLGGSIRDTARYALRWPGWSDFWRPLKKLGMLSREPISGLPGPVSPFDVMAASLAPRLQYGPDEKDVVAMVNVFEGIRDGHPTRVTNRLLMERDPATGLLAMSQAVGFTASIAAQMLARGEIEGTGVLSPLLDVPAASFLSELASRGVALEEHHESLE